MRIIAGIGARKTPTNIQQVMYDLGFALARQGRMLHSGGAENADRPFQDGVEAYCESVNINPCERQKIFIPRAYFKGLTADSDRGVINFLKTENYEKAIELAKRTYINKDSAKNWPDWMEHLMGRNGYQILSEDLITPVNAVICWTKDGSLDGSTKSSGGTGQALRLAHANNIPVFNLQRDKHLQFVMEHIIHKGLSTEPKYTY
jgi:hypothetical protein